MLEVYATKTTEWPERPGEFTFSENDDSLIYCCPCGCGIVREVDFDKGETPSPRWVWNRNREKPSMVPGLTATTGCKWDGYLIDGVFKSAGE